MCPNFVRKATSVNQICLLRVECRRWRKTPEMVLERPDRMFIFTAP
jgi:hypothetical protein